MIDSSIQDIDDDAIVAQARDNPAELAPIYQRYSNAVYRMCLRACGDPDLADDLTAKVFLTVIERLHQYSPSPTGSFRAWLFVIARNAVHDHWRRNRRLTPLTDDSPEPLEPAPGPEEVALHNITLEELRLVLATLNSRHRSIVELRLAGLSTQEIADAMEVSLPALKSAQTRAYATIRQRFAAPGEQ